MQRLDEYWIRQSPFSEVMVGVSHLTTDVLALELRENERNQFLEMTRSYIPPEKLRELVAEESNTDYYNSTDMLFKRLIRLTYSGRISTSVNTRQFDGL